MTGKSSDFPLMRLASKYAEMQTDGRLLSNRQSIEIVRYRIQELLQRLQDKDAPERFQKLYKLWQRFKTQTDKMEEHIMRLELDEIFEAIFHDYAAWENMFLALDLDRKLVESEVKIIKDIKALLTAEDAYRLTSQLLASIMDAVNETDGMTDIAKNKFLKRIQYEFTRIVGDGFEEGTEPGGGEVIDSGPGDVD